MLPVGVSVVIGGTQYKDFATGVFLNREKGAFGEAMAGENGNRLFLTNNAALVDDVTLLCTVGGDADKLFDKAEKLYETGDRKAALFAVEITKTVHDEQAEEDYIEAIVNKKMFMISRKSGEFNNNAGETILINEVHLKG